MLVVYFSSTTENTHRFVQKLNLPAQRIPLRRIDGELEVHEPFVLITPTYGGGASISGQNSRPVPKQVIQFLNNPDNRSYLRGIIASGNSNFGTDFGIAGDVISGKTRVPYLYRFELMGTPEDVARCREGILQFEAELREAGVLDLPNVTQNKEKKVG
ncbi:class Ib ribonucleoside-diphosphate reductase assembly flavoprotein NrdI [Corynebacterium ulceribovis]|uniref:class Ib ribonucleoside-diphosphate reductase assembly flavoprotein NrdI n=1 Tax=Corynebacterium ulceribovis TaxID=487732 RepID=UPI00058E4C66|nr:class Ib ribonucleoside-diphosphate reductase assembly flavoprotein NrdI [Corynebacterium ulceribovis]